MRYEIKLQDGQKLIVDKAFWTGKIEVRLDNGILGTRGWNSVEPFTIKFKDGSEHSLVVKHAKLDPMPYVLLDGNDILASQRFSKAQTAVICLPIVLIVQLGAIPALVACASVYLNFFIARDKRLSQQLRWAAIGAVPLIGFIFLQWFNVLIWGTFMPAEKQRKHKHKLSTGHVLQTAAPPKMPDWTNIARPASQVEQEVQRGY